MRITFALIPFVAVAVTAGQTLPVDHVLDVVSYRFSEAVEEPPVGIRSHASSSSEGNVSPLNKTIRLTLFSLERDEFRWGDSCIYEVLIENIGREPIVIPWSPDRNLFPISARDAMSWYLDGAVGLEVLGRRGSRPLARLKLQPLFGSDTVGGSLQTVAAGQRAMIRIPGQWRASEAEIAEVARHQPDGLVSVAATLDLFDQVVHVRSINAIDITVSGSAR
jgi:hypothetical protein